MELSTSPYYWNPARAVPQYHEVRPRSADGYYELCGNIKVWHERKA